MILFVGSSTRAELESLRGASIESDSVSSEVRRYKQDDRPALRAFVQQPPLIPHKIQGYLINLRANKCLGCHAWDTYREKRAPKISLTHFRDREGNELSDVAATRYFCLQCHVPQTDLPPLVENRFMPVEALGPTNP